jgi:hypothetical protein
MMTPEEQANIEPTEPTTFEKVKAAAEAELRAMAAMEAEQTRREGIEAQDEAEQQPLDNGEPQTPVMIALNLIPAPTADEAVQWVRTLHAGEAFILVTPAKAQDGSQIMVVDSSGSMDPLEIAQRLANIGTTIGNYYFEQQQASLQAMFDAAQVAREQRGSTDTMHHGIAPQAATDE